MIYKSTKIIIKPLTKEIIDDSCYRNWFNNPLITQFSSHGVFPLTEEGINLYLQKANNKSNITWAIMLTATRPNPHIGNIALQEIDYINRSAELAILIGVTEYCGKGVATEACELVISHAFTRLNLNRVWIGTPELNKGMIGVAKKVGMEIEGRLIKAFWYNDKYIDIVKYSIVKEK